LKVIRILKKAYLPSLTLKSVWAVVIAVLLAGCSNSEDNVDGAVSSSAPFSNSDFVNERFGTLTTREMLPQVNESTQADVVKSLNNFSFDMHRAISTGSPNEGSVESGYSAALALLLTSAATGGDTYTTLIGLLGMDAIIEDNVHTAINELALTLESRTNDDLVLHTANRVFVKPGLDLQTQFLDRATADYGAPITEANFAEAPDEVAQEVNGWVSNQTNNFIPSIIDQFDPSTVFALLNVIFLDAKWQGTYESAGEQPFNNIDGTTNNVPSFSGRSGLQRLIRNDLTALEIPYGGDEIAMLILMPNSIENLEASLNAEGLSEIVNAMETSDIQFTVPNWQQSSELDLLQLLSPLGLPGNPWNFERLVNEGTTLDVFARQRAKIEVDENGTRAAAVTAVVSVGSVPEPIIIDQPFIYVLRDRATGVVLFTGRVVAP
jgi:serpin B